MINACYDDGIEMLILSTKRDEEQQAIRYKIGRETPGQHHAPSRPLGHVATDHPPGFSFHHFGLAIDMWPIVDSIVIWDFSNPIYARVWRVVRRLARDPAINLRAGSEYKLSTGIREWGHFWYSAGLSIEAIRAGERLPDVQI